MVKDKRKTKGAPPQPYPFLTRAEVKGALSWLQTSSFIGGEGAEVLCWGIEYGVTRSWPSCSQNLRVYRYLAPYSKPTSVVWCSCVLSDCQGWPLNCEGPIGGRASNQVPGRQKLVIPTWDVTSIVGGGKESVVTLGSPACFQGGKVCV